MPRAFSVDLRERVVAAAQHQTLATVAQRFAVSASTVYKWCRRAREMGNVLPTPHTGGPARKLDAAGDAVLTALVLEQNDRTLAELARLYTARTGVPVSLHTIWRGCERLDLRRKKKEPLSQRADAHGRGERAGRVARGAS